MSDTTDGDVDSDGRTSQETPPFGSRPDPASDATSDIRLDGHVEQYDDAPDECTIFPRTASSDLPRTTTWLTALEGSYCSLEERR
jgi:hypothetical protein